jgi:predicted enzyme related to lactoylglutathione lyase
VISRFVVVVRTAAVDATVAFYRDVLGGEVSGAHGRATFVQIGPGVVEVLADEPNAPTREGSETTMLALEVESLDGWTDRLSAAAAPLLYGPIDLEGGGESLGTSDPNGVSVNLFTVP